jgi:VanZ family protein
MIMVILWVNALGKKYPTKNLYMNLCIVVSCAATIHGVAMEFIQLYFVPNRDFELNDIFADATGAVIGSLYSVGRHLKK